MDRDSLRKVVEDGAAKLVVKRAGASTTVEMEFAPHVRWEIVRSVPHALASVLIDEYEGDGRIRIRIGIEDRVIWVRPADGAGQTNVERSVTKTVSRLSPARVVWETEGARIVLHGGELTLQNPAEDGRTWISEGISSEGMVKYLKQAVMDLLSRKDFEKA